MSLNLKGELKYIINFMKKNTKNGINYDEFYLEILKNCLNVAEKEEEKINKLQEEVYRLKKLLRKRIITQDEKNECY
ncbi:hypothetical protein IX317_002138 [Fusobacterium sp. DD29]|uniref:hypothetical protein n=1 Tax=unclassified Fusobacterium TaxID=2648384 RepID=UPI001B8A9FCD|nr:MULTISPECIES: hypothetical protein [unclassified Fusobacterium]MBR8750416.1 hypothetical protein [Fusobacterium sp. DD29]MBR8762657.1 hypothetical protein [Fusobacterium sp. DD25]MBR8768686.1 hypothetical protein [Fusobacterium sp. DD43]MBR8772759.1 hypothetical protein [Fusobacterium sp. DD40]MBR8776968.1 hypothetical protein [Fusobacterium sp. DD17]